MARTLCALALIAWSFLGGAARAQPCQPDWTNDFPIADLNGPVTCFAVFDDGTGQALYVGGWITSAGGVKVRNIARWDGHTWSDVGGGLLNKLASGGGFRVGAMAVYDDGDGPGLYVGGAFDTAGAVPVQHLARWKGGQWSAVATFNFGGSFPPVVHALAVFDDGSGPGLYVAGSFIRMNGVANTANIARLKGGVCTPLGSGTDSAVNALAVYDDGDGPMLYAAGEFSGAFPAYNTRHIARWTGTTWQRLGDAGVGPDRAVRGLAVYDDGTGRALYVCGEFSTIYAFPTVHAAMVARWRGGVWSALTPEWAFTFEPSPPYSEGGYSLTPIQTVAGPRLVVSGGFKLRSTGQSTNVAAYDGQGWSELPGGVVNGPVYAALVHDDGRGPSLFVGGNFTSTGSGAANRVARWHDEGWTTVQGGLTNAPNDDFADSVRAFAAFNSGGGQLLYAGGVFRHIGAQEIWGLADWDGDLLHGVVETYPRQLSVRSLKVFDSGDGPSLYVGGAMDLQDAGLAHIARWDGLAWSPLDQGLTPPPGAGGASPILAVHDDSSGPALFVSGRFAVSTGGQPAVNIAKWDGSQWHNLGSGIPGQGLPPVNALASLRVVDDQILYAAGKFASAGGTPATNIAAWDGADWSAVATSSAVKPETIYALSTFAGALYAGGTFRFPDNTLHSAVARLDGGEWTVLGDISPLIGRFVTALAFFDDGAGPALYAGGDLSGAQIPKPNTQIARWTGSEWIVVEGGIDGSVLSLTGYDDGTGPSLFVGGTFAFAGTHSSGCIAKLQGCKQRCAADYNGDSLVDETDAREFIGVFEAGRPSADTNGDGFIDGIDYDQFMNAFEAGC